uniref:Kallikrein-7 n=1 Tax=Lygus hesperus TaxID=30085 RepID=A0A0A9ZIG5_LYGHE
MGRILIEFVGILALVIFVIEVTVGIHDDARKNLQEDWKKECPLDAYSTYPWVVKIWDIDYGMIMSHGFIVAHQVILSTCVGFIDANLRISQYRIIGQNLKNPKDLCFQMKLVAKLQFHPKCWRSESLKRSGRSEKFVNLAAWIIKDHFNYDVKDGFPSLKFPVDTSKYHEGIRKLEANAKSPGCSVPFYSARTRMNSPFEEVSSVSLIPYKSQCVDLICEDAVDTAACKKINTTSKEDAKMCAVPDWTVKLSNFGLPDTDWYEGAPLICSGVGYGLLTRIRFRLGDRQDVFIMTTFIKHTKWIQKTIKEFENLTKEEDYHRERSITDLEIGDKPDARKSGATSKHYQLPLSAILTIFSSLLC